MKIHCDVFEDIKPLVEDGVASEETVKLYKEHLEECPACREKNRELNNDSDLWDKNTGNDFTGIEISPDTDRRIVSTIQKKLKLFYSFLIISGIAFGVISVAKEDMSILYNFIFLPIVGGLGYLLFEKKWYRLPLIVLGVLFAIAFVKYLFISGSGIGTAFISALWFGGIAALLTFIGGAIVFLLNYGFRSK